MTYQTIADTYKAFMESVAPAVIDQYGADDTVAMSEAWNDYTDAECKEGNLSDLQYQHCPAVDDVDQNADEDEELEILLGDIGVSFQCGMVSARGDGVMNDMPRHFHCTIRRSSKVAPFDFYYSQGAAHTQSPTILEAMGCLMIDANGVDNVSFEDWRAETGMDDDSRKAFAIYEACEKTLDAMREMFTAQERADLSEHLSDAGY